MTQPSRIWLAKRGSGALTAAGAVVREAAAEFQQDRARRLSAGLAYYALFALIPTLLLAAAIAAAFVGREAAAGELQATLADTVGPDAAEQIEAAVASLWETTDTSTFVLVGIGVVLLSASILFVAWRDTVELIWDVPYEPSLERTLRTRAFAILVPIGGGLLLTVTMLLEGILGFVVELVDSPILDATLRTAGSVGQAAISVIALGVVFRNSVRVGRPSWRDVWPASIVVVAVLSLGFWGYGLYLRFIGATSVAAAASSVFLGLVIVYYAAQVLLFGAEMIKVLGRREAAGSAR